MPYDHGSAPESNARQSLIITLAITATMLVAEVIGGILTGSLALFASWLAGRVATLEPTPGACSLDTSECWDARLAQPTVPAHHHAH